MRAHVKVRSTTTSRLASDRKSGVRVGDAEHFVDVDGWVHLYDVGAFELKKLLRAFAEVEVADWGDLDRREYEAERKDMEGMLDGK